MKTVEVSTTVHAPPGDVYDFLLDFPGYAAYSKHLVSVRADGDGGPGTRYQLTFKWWKFRYTVHSRVTGVERPDRIDWEVTRDLDASGRWLVEPLDGNDGADGDDADASDGDADANDGVDDDPTCRVRFVVNYDPESARGVLDLPVFLSLDRVIEKAAGVVVNEGERVVERVVADLEGRRRPVDLDVSVY